MGERHVLSFILVWTGSMVWLGRRVTRRVLWGLTLWHTLRSLELVGHLVLVRHRNIASHVRCRERLRCRPFKHVLVALVFVTDRKVPGGWRVIRGLNSTV